MPGHRLRGARRHTWAEGGYEHLSRRRLREVGTTGLARNAPVRAGGCRSLDYSMASEARSERIARSQHRRKQSCEPRGHLEHKGLPLFLVATGELGLGEVGLEHLLHLFGEGDVREDHCDLEVEAK